MSERTGPALVALDLALACKRKDLQNISKQGTALASAFNLAHSKVIVLPELPSSKVPAWVVTA